MENLPKFHTNSMAFSVFIPSAEALQKIYAFKIHPLLSPFEALRVSASALGMNN